MRLLSIRVAGGGTRRGTLLCKFRHRTHDLAYLTGSVSEMRISVSVESTGPCFDCGSFAGVCAGWPRPVAASVGVMSHEELPGTARPEPAMWVSTQSVAADRGREVMATNVNRDGRTWRLGTATDVAWINAGTTVCMAITSAIPAVFDAYATIVIPEDAADQIRYESALISALRAHDADQPWWLGYLDTGADDVVSSDAPRVRLYAAGRTCSSRQVPSRRELAPLGARLVLVRAPA